MKQLIYVSFWLASSEMTPDQITDSVGYRPRKTSLKGSKRSNPPRPIESSWSIIADDTSRELHDQVQEILGVVRSIESNLQGLLLAVPQVVRAGLSAVFYVSPELGEMPDFNLRLEAEDLRLLGRLDAVTTCDVYVV